MKSWYSYVERPEQYFLANELDVSKLNSAIKCNQWTYVQSVEAPDLTR